MRTLLLSGLPAETAAETVCDLLRNIPQPCSTLIARGSPFSSAVLRFDTHDEAREALRVIQLRRPEGVAARLALPIEADFETA